MKYSAGRKLIVVALSLSALFLLLIVWGAGRLIFLSAPEPMLPPKSALEARSVKFPAPPVAIDDIVARPLFWRGREAFVYSSSVEVEGKSLAPVDASSIDRVKLLGIYTGKTPGVIISHKSKRYRVSLDEEFEGWTLTMVMESAVMFENGSKSRGIALEHAFPKGKNVSQKAREPETVKKGIQATEVEQGDVGASIDK